VNLVVEVQVWRSVLIAGDGDGGADCATAVAALLQMEKEEAVKMKMGARGIMGERWGDKEVLWPGTARLGRPVATHSLPPAPRGGHLLLPVGH